MESNEALKWLLALQRVIASITLMETGKAWSTAITLTATLGELRRVAHELMYLSTNATITLGRVRPTNKHTTLNFNDLSTGHF